MSNKKRIKIVDICLNCHGYPENSHECHRECDKGNCPLSIKEIKTDFKECYDFLEKCSERL